MIKLYNTQQTKSTILFDVDGTLFNSIPTIIASFQETFTEIEEDFPGTEVIKNKIGSDLETILSPLVPKAKLSKAARTYRKIYIKKQNQGIIPLFSEVKSVLNYLKNQNYILGIVTTKMRKFTLPLLEQVELTNYFDVILGAENTTKHKPNPDPLFKAAKMLEKKIPECVYIGDALIDMQAARNAKMDFIAITTGTTTHAKFRKNGQKIILQSLEEVPKIIR